MKIEFGSKDTNRDAAMGAFEGKSKAVTVLAVSLGIAFFLVDVVVLKGDTVARRTARLDGTPEVMTFDRVGEPHTIEITTRRRVRGEYEGRPIAWTIEDPDGNVVEESSEFVSHERRFVRLTPTVAGDYTISVEAAGILGSSSSGSATVTALVGDRRIFARLFSLF